jgi:hypothetical protein
MERLEKIIENRISPTAGLIENLQREVRSGRSINLEPSSTAGSAAPVHQDDRWSC